MIERFIDEAILEYQKGLKNDGGKPKTSEFVRRCNRMYGLPGTIAAYSRINEKTAIRQVEYSLEQGKNVGTKSRKVFKAVYDVLLTPLAGIATTIGKGREIQLKFNEVGAVGWPSDLGYTKDDEKGPRTNEETRQEIRWSFGQRNDPRWQTENHEVTPAETEDSLNKARDLTTRESKDGIPDEEVIKIVRDAAKKSNKRN